MNPKHTPKPWASTPGTFGHHSIYNAIHKNGIADVMARPRCGRKEDIEKATQEGLANARLIASAPDLLEALVLAVSELRWFINLNSSPQMAEFDWKEYQDTAIMQTINTAISKATQP